MNRAGNNPDAGALSSLPFTDAVDALKELMKNPDTTRNLELLEKLTEETDSESALLPTLYGFLTHQHLMAGNQDLATRSAAQGLTLLSQTPKRRDEPFLATLAHLLADLAEIHSSRGQHRAAERAIEKAARLFGRLARSNHNRYGAAHLRTLATVTQVCTSRATQANLLSRYLSDTETYLAQAHGGSREAALELCNSLARAGRTLAAMGKHREAVQYFTRSIKYLGKIQPEFTVEQLEMSVDLGESLLAVKQTRDKGIHLLNTMLHKAVRLNALDTHARIVRVLADSHTPGIDILELWHKIFPR